MFEVSTWPHKLEKMRVRWVYQYVKVHAFQVDTGHLNSLLQDLGNGLEGFHLEFLAFMYWFVLWAQCYDRCNLSSRRGNVDYFYSRSGNELQSQCTHIKLHCEIYKRIKLGFCKVCIVAQQFPLCFNRSVFAWCIISVFKEFMSRSRIYVSCERNKKISRVSDKEINKQNCSDKEIRK